MAGAPDRLGFVFAWVVLVVVWFMAIALIPIVAAITWVKLIADDSHGGPPLLLRKCTKPERCRNIIVPAQHVEPARN